MCKQWTQSDVGVEAGVARMLVDRWLFGRPCWVACPCQEGSWRWPDKRMGDTIHPDTAVIVAWNIVSWWRLRGFKRICLRARKPQPSRVGEPLVVSARVVRAVAHALRRGERYTVREVVGGDARKRRGGSYVASRVQSNSPTCGRA